MRSLVPIALRYADQVARAGSIQQAARELNVAASAINRQILQLEAALGVPLFERLPRGMQLTAAGNAVVTLARRWHADERLAFADLQQLLGLNQGRVRIGAMDSHVNGFLPVFVEDLARDFPGISLEIVVVSTDEAVASLIGGDLDLGAIYNIVPRRDLHVLWSAELPLGCIVAASHPLAQRDSISMQEVVAYPIVLQTRTLMIRRYLEAHHGWLFNDRGRMVETNSLQLLKMLAKGGNHVAFTSELDVAPELLDGSLIFRPVRDKGAEPQTVSVAINSRKPLSRIGRIVTDRVAESIRASLADVRGLSR